MILLVGVVSTYSIYVITPILHMSTSDEYFFPDNTSGAEEKKNI